MSLLSLLSFFSFGAVLCCVSATAYAQQWEFKDGQTFEYLIERRLSFESLGNTVSNNFELSLEFKVTGSEEGTTALEMTFKRFRMGVQRSADQVFAFDSESEKNPAVFFKQAWLIKQYQAKAIPLLVSGDGKLLQFSLPDKLRAQLKGAQASFVECGAFFGETGVEEILRTIFVYFPSRRGKKPEDDSSYKIDHGPTKITLSFRPEIDSDPKAPSYVLSRSMNMDDKRTKTTKQVSKGRFVFSKHPGLMTTLSLKDKIHLEQIISFKDTEETVTKKMSFDVSFTARLVTKDKKG